MIIKKVNIIAFAGIKDKQINFEKGVNVVYGENEKGKSTIQNFIKIWLFGISTKRTKDIKSNERLRYTPISGEKIRGELHVEHNNREYIIRRSFGVSKKEDTSEIIDSLTGESVNEVPANEPGKYFLNINVSTFSKTLFISQLGVVINKDREEEMMERSANLLGSGDENVSIKKAMEKLESLKKTLTTQRKNGKLDCLKDKYSHLLEERYDGYKLTQVNIDDENKYIELKNKRSLIRKELNNLDIYKKYIKKIKLQKEYAEITQYLRKSEEIKKKQKCIEESIITSEGIIDDNLLNDIKEENGLLFRLMDLKEESEEKLKNNFEIYENKRSKFNELLFIEKLDSNVKENFLRVTMEQESLREKISRWEILNEEILQLQHNINERKNIIGSAIKFRSIRAEVESLLNCYQEKLKELKFRMENSDVALRTQKDSSNLEKSLKIHKVILIVAFIVNVIVFNKIKESVVLLIPFIGVYLYMGRKLFGIAIELKTFDNKKASEDTLKYLSDEIQNIEQSLFAYKDIVNAQNYKDFIKKLREYDDFVDFEEKEKFRIEEKNKLLECIDIEKIKETFNKNLVEINNVLELAKTKDISTVIEMIMKYESVNKELLSLKIEIENLKDATERFDSEIKIREERVRDKLNIIGLKDIDLIDLEERVQEIKEKLAQREDLIRSLDSIKETYKALTKDKDIDAIKEELKDIINENIQYSYTSEDEIDSQIKDKSNELIEIEKNIKDVENCINARFIGKRALATIEEEIEETQDKIRKYEIHLKAIELAIAKLGEAFRDIRGSFGPILNEKVLYYFKKLSGSKYNEVLISDSYEIKVRDEKSLVSADILSNGVNDQLYISLRLAFISILFDKEQVPVILDDAFVQYDNERVGRVLEVLNEVNFGQLIIFTCQTREKEILERKDFYSNYIFL